MMHEKQHLSGCTSFFRNMENQPNETSSIEALQSAYLRVILQRRANASMLKWSLDHAAAEKERSKGKGVTLYLL